MTATALRDIRPAFVPAPVKSRSEAADPEGEYFVVTYTGSNWTVDLPSQSMTPWRRYDVGGDHLTVTDVSGADVILVRLGKFTNPPIRVRRGMTLKRRFRQFWIASVGLTAADTTLFRPTTDATIVVSTGPLVVSENPATEGRIERGFLAQRNCIATTTSRLLIQDLFDRGLVAADVPVSIGKENETLIIRNDDTVSTLYVLYGLAGQPWAGAENISFPIPAGSSLTLCLGDAIAGYDPYHFGSPPVATFYEGLCVVTDAATCRYSWLASANRTERINGREYYAGVGY